MNDDKLDFEKRQLCPDGACIGLLDANGTCKECGKSVTHGPYRGEPSVLAEADNDEKDKDETDFDDNEDDGWDEDDNDNDNDNDWDDDDPETNSDDDQLAAGPVWDDRSLCPDGACTGVLSVSGRCPECGHQASRSLG